MSILTSPPPKRRKVRGGRSVFSRAPTVEIRTRPAPMSRRSRFASSRRNLDKKLIAIAQTVTTTQQATVLFTSTFPCTLTGIRWSIAFGGNTTSANNLFWAIVMIKDGDTLSTMSTSTGADFFTPEQNVLSFGVIKTADSDGGTGPMVQNIMGSTKTMRKYMGGDTLQFICIGTAGSSDVRGVVQFFCKV